MSSRRHGHDRCLRSINNGFGTTGPSGANRIREFAAAVLFRIDDSDKLQKWGCLNLACVNRSHMPRANDEHIPQAMRRFNHSGHSSKNFFTRSEIHFTFSHSRSG